MTTLRVERVSYEYGDPFDVDGKIVAVLRHTVQSRSLSLLVEGEGVTEFVALDDADETTFCSGTRADGSRCTRDVDEVGDVCWQHEEDDQ